MTETRHPDLGHIMAVSTRRLRRALQPAWGPGVDWLDLVICSIQSSEGQHGIGFAWTPGVIAGAISSILQDDIEPLVRGRPVEVEQLWDRVVDHFGTMRDQAPVTMAVGAFDLGLWDLVGRAAGASVAQLIGTVRSSVDVYRSGINFYRPLEDIAAQADAWSTGGAEAIKIKVGRPDVRDDVRVVSQVRRAVGSSCRLMLDANQRWTLDQALRAVEHLAGYDIAWLEEPLRSIDPKAVRRLHDASPIPLALGENLYSTEAFAEIAALDAIDIVQPNIVRVGGITPFVRIVKLSEQAGMQVVPHLLPEISAQLALTLPGTTMVEVADGYTFMELGLLEPPWPVELVGQQMVPTGLPGLGLTFPDH